MTSQDRKEFLLELAGDDEKLKSALEYVLEVKYKAGQVKVTYRHEEDARRLNVRKLERLLSDTAKFPVKVKVMTERQKYYHGYNVMGFAQYAKEKLNEKIGNGVDVARRRLN